jgi:hypothetical protein
LSAPRKPRSSGTVTPIRQPPRAYDPGTRSWRIYENVEVHNLSSGPLSVSFRFVDRNDGTPATLTVDIIDTPGGRDRVGFTLPPSRGDA